MFDGTVRLQVCEKTNYTWYLAQPCRYLPKFFKMIHEITVPGPFLFQRPTYSISNLGIIIINYHKFSKYWQQTHCCCEPDQNSKRDPLLKVVMATVESVGVRPNSAEHDWTRRNPIITPTSLPEITYPLANGTVLACNFNCVADGNTVCRTSNLRLSEELLPSELIKSFFEYFFFDRTTVPPRFRFGLTVSQGCRVLTYTSSERENLRFFTLQVPEFQLQNLKNNLH